MQNKWPKEKLGNLLIRKKDCVKIDDSKQYTRLTIKMNSGGIKIRDIVKGDRIGTKNQFLVKERQLLLSKIDARNGAFGVVPKEADGAIITGNFWAYEVNKSKLDEAYFEYLTRTNKFLEFCINSSQGATNRRYLQEPIFLAREIVIPPISEQKRVVARIKMVEKKRNSLNKLILGRKKFIDSLLFSYLHNLFINNKFFNAKSEYLIKICDIYQPKTISTAELLDDGEFPVFGANGIIGYYNKYNYSEPEVLLTCRGATCGTMNMSKPFSWINGNAMVVTPKNKEIDKTFLFYYLFALNLKTLIKGSAQPQLTQHMLRDIKLSIPKINEQKKVISIISDFRKVLEDVQKQQKMVSINMDQFMPSLLSKAFNGEL